ncbi:MAG: hypothetical protein V7724_10120 [Sediminicola sp.]|tara:strand:- start:19099 stop:19758 length:660 start_codon:yes stop_codon:yes gene_type:complete
MKKSLFYLFCFVVLGSNAQKNIYESEKFDELSQDHKVLAILPFLTNLELEDTIEKEEVKALEKKEGYAVQEALEIYFSRINKKKKFGVAFQNTEDTNAILARNDISYENMDVHTVKEICKILEVDGIISGSMDINILLSKGIPSEFNLMDFFLGDADYGRIGLKISDGATSKLLWKYEKEINKKSGKNTNALIDGMMKAATRKFPYDKERQRNKRKNQS